MSDTPETNITDQDVWNAVSANLTHIQSLSSDVWNDELRVELFRVERSIRIILSDLQDAGDDDTALQTAFTRLIKSLTKNQK